jgi:hypothetical protein
MYYVVGHPIKNPADFYGRFSQVTRFFEIVAGQQTQSASVLGLRRAGKTSFLHYVANPAVLARHIAKPDRYVLIYLDMSFIRSPAEFYQRLLNRLQAALGVQVRNGRNGAASPKAGMYDVEALLSRYPEKRFVLLLDEFDQLQAGEFDQSFLVELRALSGGLEYELACVTASFWDLYRLGTTLGLPPTSPFYNIFYPTPFYLAGFDTADAEALIRTPAARAGIPLHDEEVMTIWRLAGSLPFFLQATAARWLEEKKRTAALPDAAEMESQLVSVLAPYFAQWRRHLNPLEWDVLMRVAGVTADPGDRSWASFEAQEALRRLSAYGLITQNGGATAVNGALFTAWLHRQTAPPFAEFAPVTEAPKMDPAALRQALVDHFNLEELRTLCFDLDVDFDRLPGQGKDAKARDLVIYWQNRNGLARLVAAVRLARGPVI